MEPIDNWQLSPQLFGVFVNYKFFDPFPLLYRLNVVSVIRLGLQVALYLLSSLGGLFGNGAGRLVLWVTHVYARAYDLTPRLRPGIKRSTGGENEIYELRWLFTFARGIFLTIY